MKRLLWLIPIVALAAVSYPLAVSHTPKASASAPPITCTINHWMRDVSQTGTPLVGVDPGDNDQLVDEANAVGYPTNFIYELCAEGGLFYLENQMPGGQVHPWIGDNSALDNAVTDTADGPGGYGGSRLSAGASPANIWSSRPTTAACSPWSEGRPECCRQRCGTAGRCRPNIRSAGYAQTG